ncbi:protein BIG GRAIN 1-like A [Salvia miltiorrhiza]|uniref:protein BIG GRAIN 1-like A n=1 Tax=Salvia miltiorrhiza TaxID=226208 RepID=UPI0025AB9A2A|nr:protein BIG GRAIN 1-like A [Salvia miltiorrhiza]
MVLNFPKANKQHFGCAIIISPNPTSKAQHLALILSRIACIPSNNQNMGMKGPSFSSSLLDAIYRSIDETNASHTRNAATKVEDDIESLRRAIVIEKWIEKQYSMPRHLASNSASSTDSSVFSSSETDSRGSPKTSKPKREARKTSKKVKEPISPGAKISNFFNSIFSPRNFKSTDEWSSMRKSRSMKDTTTTYTRSCLTKNASSRPKRSVRFSQDEFAVGSQFIKKNIDSFRHYHHESERDFDDMSCASSDLFELQNIEEELPVYETTSLGGMVM